MFSQLLSAGRAKMAHNASLAVRIRRPRRTGHGRTDRRHGIGAHRLLREARPAIPHCQVLLSLARRGNNIALRVVSPCEGCGTPDAQLNSQGDPMKIFTTFCCAALALCSAIYAQSPNDHITVHFDTPVIVGETKLPAGDCDIQVMRGSSYSIILVIRSQAGPYTAAVASRLFEDNSVAEGTIRVVLDRRGNDLHLYRILLTDHTGFQLQNAE